MTPGLIEELEGYSEEDYPDAQNKITQQVFTPAEVKDLDSSTTKYQVLERFYKTQVPFYRITIGKPNGQMPQELVLSENEFQMYIQDNP